MTYSSPETAEAAFYAAFETRDLDTMMAIWGSDDDIICIHPLAAPLDGRGPVAAGWKSIFEAAELFRIQVELAQEIRETDRVIRVVREYLSIGQESEPRSPILATNIYQKKGDAWYLILHHASPLQVGNPPPPRTSTHVLH